MNLEYGRISLLPFAPLDEITAPMEAAIPKTVVDTSDLMKSMTETSSRPE